MTTRAIDDRTMSIAFALTVACGGDPRDDGVPDSAGGVAEAGSSEGEPGTAGDGGDDGANEGGAHDEDADGGAHDEGASDSGGDDGGNDGGDDAGDDGQLPDAGAGDDDGSNDGGDGDCGTPPDLTGCSIVAPSPKTFLEWVNGVRDMYGGAPPYGYHTRYKGMPWVGEGHSNNTFPWHFTWDDTLACQAQEEAERLAAGGSPEGQRADHQSNYLTPPRPFFVHGLNTADWRLSAKELNNDEWFALAQNNGSARMGLFYHDFGGDGPVISRVGIGAAIVGDCTEIWWVLQFGP